MRFNHRLKVYKFKDFEKVLNKEGFYVHHKNSTHVIFANSEGYYVTVPGGGKKEINAMMTTVTLQRIRNKQCRKLDKQTMQKYA